MNNSINDDSFEAEKVVKDLTTIAVNEPRCESSNECDAYQYEWENELMAEIKNNKADKVLTQ